MAKPWRYKPRKARPEPRNARPKLIPTEPGIVVVQLSQEGGWADLVGLRRDGTLAACLLGPGHRPRQPHVEAFCQDLAWGALGTAVAPQETDLEEALRVRGAGDPAGLAAELRARLETEGGSDADR